MDPFGGIAWEQEGGTNDRAKKRKYVSQVRVKRDKETLREEAKKRQKGIRTEMKSLFMELAVELGLNCNEKLKVILQTAVCEIRRLKALVGGQQGSPDWPDSASKDAQVPFGDPFFVSPWEAADVPPSSAIALFDPLVATRGPTSSPCPSAPMPPFVESGPTFDGDFLVAPSPPANCSSPSRGQFPSSPQLRHSGQFPSPPMESAGNSGGNPFGAFANRPPSHSQDGGGLARLGMGLNMGMQGDAFSGFAAHPLDCDLLSTSAQQAEGVSNVSTRASLLDVPAVLPPAPATQVRPAPQPASARPGTSAAGAPPAAASPWAGLSTSAASAALARPLAPPPASSPATSPWGAPLASFPSSQRSPPPPGAGAMLASSAAQASCGPFPPFSQAPASGATGGLQGAFASLQIGGSEMDAVVALAL